MRKLLMLMLGLFVLCTQLLAQNRVITGTILDKDGQPLPGTSIRIIGEKIGTVTNAQGTFSINVPQKANRVEVSAVGYSTQILDIPASGELNLTMQQSENNQLNEVVVTGYSRQRKAEYSGAGSKVTADEVNLVPMGSLDQILQGRSPGLLVTVGSGQPGSAARVQIRGASSISGSSNPLYVIDGVPVEQGVFQSINPNDIESVDVLRDASATSLYGNRGGAGVIVVTTKKGRAGKTQVGYNGQAGITQPGKQRFDMMNSAEILQFQEDLGRLNGTALPGWTYSKNNPAYNALSAATKAAYDKRLDSLRGIDVDWADVFQRTGTFQSHDVNLSGGSGKTRFFTSVGLYDEEGIATRSDMTRYSFRTNIDHATDKLSVSLNAFAGYTLRNFVESEGSVTLANPFAAAYLGLPYHNLYNADGSVATGDGRVGPNAYDRILTTSNDNQQLKSNLSINAQYQLTKNFNIGGFVGTDYRTTTSERQINPFSFAANAAAFPVGRRYAPFSRDANGNFNTDTLARGSYGETMTRYFSMISRGNIGYRTVFSDLHDIDVQTFIEYNRIYSNNFSYTGYGIRPALLGTGAGVTAGDLTNGLIPAVGGGRSQRAYLSGIATARYTFDKKYTLNASFRRDAASILPAQNRQNNFFSVGATWNALKENFAINWKFFNDLRVRGSYGTAANAENFPLGDFSYLTSYGAATYSGGIQQGQAVAISNAGNPDARWEQVRTANVGIDFAVLRNRITGALDVYDKLTRNNLVSQNLSATSGLNSLTINAAKIQNRGIELQLNADVVKTRSFNFNVGGNISYNKNEVLDLGDVSEFEQGTAIIREGLPLGSHYMVKWAGVDASSGKPLYYTKEGKVTDVYSATNSVAEFGTYNAPWIGGFNAGITYKGLSLEAFFTFQQGFSRFNNQDYFQLNHAFAVSGYNLSEVMKTMWKQPGDVTNIQSPLYAREFSSKDIQDASYLRFRNLNLSYNFGQNVVNSLRVLSGLRVFAQAQNLYTWTKWTGFDPEDSNNIASYEYPTPRTITFGLNVNFK
jgi:TonB-linked SusC/RagA family outer membrane protein